MDEMNQPLKNELREMDTLRKVGLVSSLSLSALTAITFSMAICTPPISGPFSKAALTSYPYTDVISRFPRDYYWMYPAMLMVLVFVVYMACVADYAGPERRIFSRIALLFATLSAGILLVDYFVQVAVIQPSLMKGEYDGLAILSQYNPHGIFIALEEAGYLLMSISMLCLLPVFSGSGRIQAWIGRIGLLNFALTVLAWIGIAAVYGVSREYRFEVAVITFNFSSLIALGLLSSALFRRNRGNKREVR